jgi:starch phosphorylase
MHPADFCSYSDAQTRVMTTYTDAREWARRALLYVPSGTFSSDRTIRQCVQEIWKYGPVPDNEWPLQ